MILRMIDMGRRTDRNKRTGKEKKDVCGEGNQRSEHRRELDARDTRQGIKGPKKTGIRDHKMETEAAKKTKGI